jgi:hypothetical protein
MQVLKENVDLSSIDPSCLTSDCKFVKKVSGQIDIVREYSSVRVFDYYWDRGIKLVKIWHAGGTRNPKFQKHEV